MSARGAKRRPVVLYQPRDDGSVMPLGLLALGSWLSGEHVVVVDGRFELAPEARIVELARGALCLGVTVRTGAPMREALRVSAAARAARPDLDGRLIEMTTLEPLLDKRLARRKLLVSVALPRTISPEPARHAVCVTVNLAPSLVLPPLHMMTGFFETALRRI